MAEPTLTQIFGAGATQDASTLSISKTALATVGLTVSSSNKAEALLIAILLLAQQYLTQANQDANSDQSIVISNGFLPSFVTRNNTTYRQDTLTVAMDKSAGNTTIDPDDY